MIHLLPAIPRPPMAKAPTGSVVSHVPSQAVLLPPQLRQRAASLMQAQPPTPHLPPVKILLSNQVQPDSHTRQANPQDQPPNQHVPPTILLSQITFNPEPLPAALAAPL